MKRNVFLLHVILSLAVFMPSALCAQKKVAISIDDVPNTLKYQKDNFNPKLLSKLDSLQIPVAIFVTVDMLNRNDYIDKNRELLNSWINKSYLTIGYHSYAHLKYSTTSLDSFKTDFEKGEGILKKYTGKKPINYFRLPFNDLGRDSAQHVDMVKYVQSKNYTIAPFTIESEDWMFNDIYEYYLSKNDMAKADETANDYITKTLEYFDFFDSLAVKLYGRSIAQIYLCHDNTINADYLPVLLEKLKLKKYSFISFSEALQDNVYNHEDRYFKKWGISWLYRWMKGQNEIDTYTKQEPYDDTYKLYKQLLKK